MAGQRPIFLAPGAEIVSFEGTSLHCRQDGRWELFVSSEKDQPYPPSIASLQKPGTGVWSIDVLTGFSPDTLDPASSVQALANHDVPEHLHVKDPAVYTACGRLDAHALLYASVLLDIDQ